MERKIKNIDLTNQREREKLEQLLADNDLVLDLDAEVDESIGIYEGNELIGTCSVQGRVIKGLAIKADFQEQNLTSILLGETIKRLFEKGVCKSFIFTKKKYRDYFENLGYRYLARGGDAILLEYGLDGITDYLNKLKKHQRPEANEVRGSIVMNCNPFTLGHRYVIEKAASECDWLYIFIVQEDKSLFPFNIRKNLVIEGISDLKNVQIVDGGDYIISTATFPGYFIRKVNDRIVAQAMMDIDLFSNHIAPTLGISKRFAGSEPLDEVTCLYNQIMSEELPKHGLEFIEINRKKIGDQYISASKVRDFLRYGDQTWHQWLPITTIRFLESREGQEIINKIKSTDSPH